MDSNRFETAIAAIGVSEGVLVSSGLYTVAWECDRLQSAIAEDARRMAARFAEYAATVAAGGNASSTPNGYSSLRDIDTNAARYQAKVEQLVAMVRVSCSPEAVTLLTKALASKVPA